MSNRDELGRAIYGHEANPEDHRPTVHIDQTAALAIADALIADGWVSLEALAAEVEAMEPGDGWGSYGQSVIAGYLRSRAAEAKETGGTTTRTTP